MYKLPHVEYELTELGLALRERFVPWIGANMLDIIPQKEIIYI